MCGISGFVNRQGYPLRDLKAMNDIIRHRGPDDEGFVAFKSNEERPFILRGEDTTKEPFDSTIRYSPTNHIDEVRDSSYTVSLGHRRLSILDLSNFGHQPMCSENGRYWIIYNGEIYNFKELREELIGLGYNFITSTDTEVILAAYQQWGVNCLDKFNGMWAFVIYDRQDKEIFMARDRFGIKPFYYWIAPSGTLFFASEIKEFTVCEGWKAKLNSQRAYDYLAYSLTDHTDETMFSGVFHLPPGHFFKAKVNDIDFIPGTKLKVKRWYKLKEQKLNGDFSVSSSEFKTKFKDAVKLHLRADVPVGSALSGGLDSSAIVCEISNLLEQNGRKDFQKTFSSCDTDERYDERKWMDIVIEQTNVESHFVYPDFNDVSKLTSKIIWHQDEPYQSQSAFLGYLVFELAKKNNVKVLLNGQGADEYLGGYGQLKLIYYKSLLKNLDLKGFLQNIDGAKGVNLVNVLSQLLFSKIPDSVRNYLSKVAGSSSRIRDLISVNELGAKDVHPFYDTEHKKQSVLDVADFFMFYSPLPRYLRWEDRNSMAHSIEARVPFLDYRLVEYCANQPVENLYSNDTTKLILREGLKGILPEKIVNRKDKKGFITPEERWVKENYTGVIREQLAEAIKYSDGIIKPDALDYFDKVVKGDLPFDYTYWRLILFSEWLKCFNIKV